MGDIKSNNLLDHVIIQEVFYLSLSFVYLYYTPRYRHSTHHILKEILNYFKFHYISYIDNENAIIYHLKYSFYRVHQ